MSGIGGVRAFLTSAFATEALNEMAEALRQRGPDGSSVWVGPDIGLVHTRRSVGGVEDPHQPVRSVDGRWVLALDGAVLNHQSLRARLDYPFRTESQAEVVVAGLALEGISFVERLQGQFAFVAHDLRTDTTHLVRDRLGIVPLHYRHVAGGIAFGSDIASLLAVGPAPQVDHRSLDAYLAAGSVPAPDTLFEGVKKVRPAHRISITPRGHVEEAHYWTPPESDPEGTWGPDDAIEAVGDGVREAVRSALVADAPVGAYLSGGVDSSLLVAQMCQLRGDDTVHTFAAGFDARPDDDLSWARRVSGLLGTDHHEVRLRAADVEDNWARLTRHRDAPVFDSADVVLHGLARAARQHVGVVLTGDGSDELFGGCTRHRYAGLAEHSSLVPARVRDGLAGTVGRRRGPSPFTALERARLLGTAPPPERRSSPAPGVDPVDRMLRHDLRHCLPDGVLERADRMAASASLELRPALLDHHLVELAFRLPTSMKVHAGTTKWVLREVARPFLPDDVVHRRQSTLHAPLTAWFGAGLRDMARDRLTGADSWVATTFDRSVVSSVVERHARGVEDDGRLAMLMALELWHDCFFGAPPALPRPRGEVLPPALAHGSHRA
ncbi:N-acetylglutaminylglutamine amidotransferase [Alloalcanivorax gelatiniphagus]